MLNTDDVLHGKCNMSPTQGLHVNQILTVQKLLEDQPTKMNAVNKNCDKVDIVQTHNGTNMVLKNCDYDWWIKRDSPQVKRLQTAYLQDIKIHR